MLGTAGRVTAVRELTWGRVNFEAGAIDLRPDSKGPRKGRATVPNSGLRSALEMARRAALTDHVIEWAGQPVKSITTGFNPAVKAAGLKGVTPHVPRHTAGFHLAGVHLAAAGVPMARIAQYLGHTSTTVTERAFARFGPDHLCEEAALLGFSSTRAALA